MTTEQTRLAFKVADRKYRNGDSITDYELAILIDRYRAAYEGLRGVYNPVYQLAENDLRTRLHQLEGFQQARREKRRLDSPCGW